jgi:hypothetical protein
MYVHVIHEDFARAENHHLDFVLKRAVASSG